MSRPEHFVNQTITSLRTAIAEAEKQEPVAYVTGYYDGRCVIKPLNRAMVLPVNMALYTTSPAAYPEFECPRCGHCCSQRQPLTEEKNT